jgi:hypothetical protein
MTFNASLLNGLTIGGYYLADVDATDTNPTPNARPYFDNWNVSDFVATVGPGSVEETFSGAVVRAGTGTNHIGAASSVNELGFGFTENAANPQGPVLASQGSVPFVILAYDANHVLFSAAGGTVYYLLQNTPFVDASGAPLQNGAALNLNLTSVESTSPSAPTYAPPTALDQGGNPVSPAQYTFPDAVHSYDTPVDFSAQQVAVIDASQLTVNADGSITINAYPGAVSDTTGRSPDTQVTDVSVQSNGAAGASTSNNLFITYSLDFGNAPENNPPPIYARIVGYDKQTGLFIAQQYPFSPGGNLNPGSPARAYLVFSPGNLAGNLTVSDPQNPGDYADISNATGHPLQPGFTFQKFSSAPNPCFVAGTRIATPEGEVAVEALAAGDTVLAVEGGVTRPATLVWVGRRRADVRDVEDAREVFPVRIARDAIAAGVPSRDLLISPDHAILIDGVLIAARQLVNGASITQETETTAVTYYHLELERHGVLLAEGLTAESYLDTGNRASFTQVGPLVSLRTPVATTSREARACAPLVVDAETVRPIWERLASRAASLGFEVAGTVTTNDPALTLIADGVELLLTGGAEGQVMARIPAGAGSVRIVSRTARPSDARPWLDDRRSLGVSVSAIALDGVAVDLDGAAIRDGWYAAERNGERTWRWTGGDAVLALGASDVERVLELTVATLPGYAPAAAAAMRRAAA